MKIVIQIIYIIFIFSNLMISQVDVNSVLFSKMSENEKMNYYIKEMELSYLTDPLKALDIFDELQLLEMFNNNISLQWKADRFVANSYLLIGDSERAFIIFDRLNNSKVINTNPENRFILYNDLAEAYKKIGNKSKAIKNYQLALELSRSFKNNSEIAEQLKKIGIYYTSTDSLIQAQKQLSEALEIFKNLNDDHNIAFIKLKLADVDVKKRDFTSGYKLAKEAKEYYETTSEILGQSKAVQLMGICKCREGIFGPATKLLDKAIKLANLEKVSINLKEFYFAKLELLIAKGESDSAKMMQNKIILYNDSLSLAHRNSQLTMFRKRFEDEKNEARRKSEELASQKNITLFLSIVSSLSLVFLILIVISFINKKKSQDWLTAKNKELDSINMKFSSFIDQTVEAITIIDCDNKIILWNKYFETLTGIRSEEVLNKNYTKVFKEFIDLKKSNLSELYDKNKKIFTGEIKSFDEIEFPIHSKTMGKKYILLSSFPICTEKESFVGIICRDISLQKEYEFELIKAKNLAVSSEKLKTEFITQMSHEVRSPLGAILSFTEVLKDELSGKLDEDLKDSFVSITNAGDRIIRTTDLLLNMSDIQSDTYEYIPIKIDLLSQLIDPLFQKYKSKAAKNGLQLNIKNKLNSSDIIADEFSTQQIIDNLIDNAIKYTKVGEIDIILTENENNTFIEVKDTGIGITEEYIKELFEPFSQEEQGYTRSFEGNGLGLALVKKYCEINNFNISVKSKKNEGSLFTISIPKDDPR